MRRGRSSDRPDRHRGLAAGSVFVIFLVVGITYGLHLWKGEKIGGV